MKKFFLFLSLIYSLHSYCQSLVQYQKRTLSRDDGLTLDKVNTMCQDNDGFLWLGGIDNDVRTIISSNKELSLLRFDGNTFHNITIPNLSKSTNTVVQLYKRNDGKIIITFNEDSKEKIMLFDPYSIQFETLKINANSFSKVFSYNEKDYTLTQNEKQLTLNEITESFELNPVFSFYYNVPQRFSLDSSTELICNSNYCLIGDDNFPIIITDWNGNIIKQYSNDTFGRSRDLNKKKFWIAEAFKYKAKNYVIMDSEDQLHTLNFKALEVKPTAKTINLKDALKTFQDKKGNHIILSAKDNSIVFQSIEDDSLVTMCTDNTLKNTTVIEAFSSDLDNELWLYYNDNLHHYTFSNNSVFNYLKEYEIRAIKQKDSKNIIVSTERNGWFNLNTQTYKTNPITITEGGKRFLPSSRNIIIRDSVIWSHSFGNIIKLNPKNNTTKSFRHYPIKNIKTLNDSVLVYATAGYSLMQFNTNTEKHSALLATDSLVVFDIVIKDNLILGATDKGILKYDINNKSSKLYNNLKDNFVFMCTEDDKGNPLFGTRSGYVYMYISENESFKTVYEDELNAGIAGVIIDRDTWWVNTFNGVVAFNTEKNSTYRFSEKDGFTHNEGNRYSALKTNEGIFFGTLKGLNFFNPEKLKPREDNAELTLIKANFFNKSTGEYDDIYSRAFLDNYETIELPPENRALELNFALKSNTGLNNEYFYRYRLNDNKWIELKNQNFIQFPNLEAGNYSLEIEALNFSKEKVGTSLIIPIKSKAFFYKTWWFVTSLSLIVIGVLLYFLRQFQLRKRLQDQFALDLIKSQEVERKRIARELHDSVSQQLTLIKRKAQSSEQLEISDLTNNTLEEVRHISRGLFPPLLKQLGFTESVEQLAIDIDENNDLFVSTDIENIDNNLTDENALHLYRFVQECINNILKHADAKALSITIEKEKDAILVLIKDNGKGFDVTSAKNKNSLGLKTLEERIKILNGELLIDSKLTEGTTTKAKIRLS
ncbi:MAG: hypothetical protein ED556_08930 [Winogradskyella sp.]|uniref:sensor histidine kinase n=1 Tax=Winogradskyella sp. TaxID=1883156 RepID=UPI000F40ED4C|nr:histidine kinase [Winogradskyella sp.]RNC86404.1 MAG: hypothetical protein ED556_08930 [Winogradskyella sp.]